MTRLLDGNITHAANLYYTSAIFILHAFDLVIEMTISSRSTACFSPVAFNDTFTRLCLAVLDRRIIFSSRIVHTAELVVRTEVFLIDISAILLPEARITNAVDGGRLSP